jgi:hypothetical protein
MDTRLAARPIDVVFEIFRAPGESRSLPQKYLVRRTGGNMAPVELSWAVNGAQDTRKFGEDRGSPPNLFTK